MRIYIGNFPKDVTEDDIKREFLAFGAVDSVTLIKDKFSGELRGFGFVEMPVRSEGEAAVAGLNEKDIKGKKINVNEARPQSRNKKSHKNRTNGYRGGYKRGW